MIDDNFCRGFFSDISLIIPAALLSDIQFFTSHAVIYANHRGAAHPGIVFRDKYIEILYVRRITVKIRLGRFTRIRQNPKFIRCRSKILTRKALSRSKLNATTNDLRSNTTHLAVIIQSFRNKELSSSVSTTNFSSANFIPTGNFSTLCKSNKLATGSGISSSPSIRKLEIDGTIAPRKSSPRPLHVN